MEKIGDLFNQFAIISDLIEKADLNFKETTLTFNVSPEEFQRIYKLVTQKANFSIGTPKNRFNMVIGKVNVVFDKNDA